MPTAKLPHFSKRTLEFLQKAGRQRNPAWLDKNRAEYEATVLLPLKSLAAQARAELAPVAPGYHFPQKGIGRMRRPSNWVQKGGGLYKNWMTYSASRPSGSRFEGNPNLYFMIDLNDADDTVLIAGGLYNPSSRQTRAIRAAIANDTTPFERLFATPEFKRCFAGGFSKDRTATRPPRGFDPNHPQIDWLKLQAFFVWRSYTKREFFSATFARLLARDWRQILRLNTLLDQAISRSLPATPSFVKPTLLRDRIAQVESFARPMDF